MDLFCLLLNGPIESACNLTCGGRRGAGTRTEAAVCCRRCSAGEPLGNAANLPASQRLHRLLCPAGCERRRQRRTSGPCFSPPAQQMAACQHVTPRTPQVSQWSSFRSREEGGGGCQESRAHIHGYRPTQRHRCCPRCVSGVVHSAPIWNHFQNKSKKSALFHKID